MNDGWYGALKEAIQQQQNHLVWVSEGKVRSFLLLTHLTTYIRSFWDTVFYLDQRIRGIGGFGV